MHAQQFTDQVQRSERQLLYSQQIKNTTKEVSQYIITYSQNRELDWAEMIHMPKLKTSQDMVEHTLEEWSQLRIYR